MFERKKIWISLYFKYFIIKKHLFKKIKHWFVFITVPYLSENILLWGQVYDKKANFRSLTFLEISIIAVFSRI